MRTFIKVVTAVVAALALTTAPAAGAPPRTKEHVAAEHRHDNRCEREFDRAAREDMVAFRDYDAETWRELHHPAAETVFASGHRIAGIDAIMRALTPHFSDKEAVFTWTELSRFVDRTCTLGIVVYETRYYVPSTGFDQRTTTTVTLVRERGEWLVLYDQGTELPS